MLGTALRPANEDHPYFYYILHKSYCIISDDDGATLLLYIDTSPCDLCLIFVSLYNITEEAQIQGVRGWSASDAVRVIEILYEALNHCTPNGGPLFICVDVTREPNTQVLSELHSAIGERSCGSLTSAYFPGKPKVISPHSCVYIATCNACHSLSQRLMQVTECTCFHKCEVLTRVSGEHDSPVSQQRRHVWFCHNYDTWFMLFAVEPVIVAAHIDGDKYIRFPELEEYVPQLNALSHKPTQKRC